jgi:catechol 2,3-dioxygenase-like lactoylglutathione lyase family enzyme
MLPSRDGHAPHFRNTRPTASIRRGKSPASGGISHFGFKLQRGSDLDAAAREVERGGGRVVSRGEHAPGVPFVYVSDPDGYVIELGNP